MLTRPALDCSSPPRPCCSGVARRCAVATHMHAMGTHENAFAEPPVLDHRPMSNVSWSLDIDGVAVEDVFAFMASLENLAAWHPLVRGAVRWQSHVSPLVPDTRPVGVGTTYRLLFCGALADLMRCRVHAYEPPYYVEWHCQGALRTLRLAVGVSTPSEGTVRVQVRWAWVWRGWRRVPGVARAAHRAAYAVADAARDGLERCLEHFKRGTVHVPPRQVAVTDAEEAAAPGG